MSDAEKEAEELLPCTSEGMCSKLRVPHMMACPAYYRPAVAAALAQLRAENERLTKQVRECPTCNGSGAMDVVVRALPPDGREVYETEQCAECHGTGIGSWGQAIDEANNLRAENEKLKEKCNLKDDEYAQQVAFAQKQSRVATVKALELARDKLSEIGECNLAYAVDAIRALIDAEKAQGGKHE